MHTHLTDPTECIEMTAAGDISGYRNGLYAGDADIDTGTSRVSSFLLEGQPIDDHEATETGPKEVTVMVTGITTGLQLYPGSG